MIVNDNVGIYQGLFDKANRALNYIDENGNTLKPDDVIKNIDDYFTCIKTLADYERNNGTDPIFTILPIEEETFNIDANTRKIDIPTSFLTSGIAVKGDEIAETLYFTIDRYFDVTDLYYKDILIQWKNADGDEGLSLTYNKSLSFKPGKVTFGWPISSEITKAAGNVQFSVRFYDRFEDDNSSYLTYSFGTLTAVVKVNPALDFDISDEDAITATIVDRTERLYKNIQNSKATGIINPAETPVFEEDWILPETINIDELQSTILINGKETKILKTKAHVPAGTTGGVGEITYNWIQKDAQGYIVEPSPVQGYSYIATEDLVKQGNDIYYYLDDKGNYQVYVGELPAGNGMTIYERYSYCVPATAGNYEVTATNTSGRGNSASVDDECLIPFAKQAVFVIDDKSIILERDADGNIIPQTVTYNVSTVDNGDLAYKWKYYAGYSKDDDKYADASADDAKVKDNFTNSITINEKGHYYLVATNTKNNNSIDAVAPAIRVTEGASIPTITGYKVGNDVYTTSPVSASINSALSYVKGTITNTDNIYTYQWYKQDANQTYVPIEGAITEIYSPKEIGAYKCKITNYYNEDAKDSRNEDEGIFFIS